MTVLDFSFSGLFGCAAATASAILFGAFVLLRQLFGYDDEVVNCIL